MAETGAKLLDKVPAGGTVSTVGVVVSHCIETDVRASPGVVVARVGRRDAHAQHRRDAPCRLSPARCRQRCGGFHPAFRLGAHPERSSAYAGARRGSAVRYRLAVGPLAGQRTMPLRGPALAEPLPSTPGALTASHEGFSLNAAVFAPSSFPPRSCATPEALLDAHRRLLT